MGFIIKHQVIIGLGILALSMVASHMRLNRKPKVK